MAKVVPVKITGSVLLRRVVLSLVGMGLLGYFAVCTVLFVQQRSQIYFAHAHSPLGQPETQTLMVDGTPVYVATREHPGAQALVYFGGNADDVSRALPELAAMYPQRALYLLHYRSYGGSPGQPTEVNLTTDALALFDKVHAEHPEVMVVGRSLGTGLAVRVASVRPAAGVVLITPYASLVDMAALRYPYIPVGWLLLDKYASKDHAPRVRAPTLLIAAGKDEVIPLESTRSLFRAFQPGVAQLKIIPGVGHGSIMGSPALRALLAMQ